MRSSYENMHEYRVTHVLWIIWDAELDGDAHFNIWSKVRSSSGKKDQILIIKFLFLKIIGTFLAQFCLGIPKMSFIFFLYDA